MMKTDKTVNLFILGVQKAGTSALAEFLAAHPDICLVQGKEAHVFDDPEYHRSAEKTAFAKHKFDEKLRHYASQEFICDATPITILHPQFLAECVRYNSTAKYIVILRNPVDRAFSHYQMSRSRGLEARSVFHAFLAETWKLRDWLKQLPEEPFESPYRDHSYLLRGRYSRQLATLYHLVSPQQVLVLNQEELLNNHENVMTDVFRFIGVENRKISAKKVFTSQYEENLPVAARIVAKLYYWLHRESY